MKITKPYSTEINGSLSLIGISLFSTQRLTNHTSKSLRFVRRSCHNRNVEISVEPRNYYLGNGILNIWTELEVLHPRTVHFGPAHMRYT